MRIWLLGVSGGVVQGDGVQLPVRMNNVPHPRETREFFYDDVAKGVRSAIADAHSRLAIR